MKKILLSFLFGISFLFLGANIVSANPAGDNIIISEVEYNPSGTESASEWFELYNPTISDIDINGWSFTDGEDTYTVPVSFIIPSGEYRVLAHTAANVNAQYGAGTVDFEYGVGTFGVNIQLGNSGDELTLLNGATTTDSVSWGSHATNVTAGNGESISRANSIDTDNDNDWQSHQAPTPGTGSLTLTDPAMDFVITVKTDNPGTSDDLQFTIPTTGTGYDYEVDCDNSNPGTNVSPKHQSGSYTCDYGVGNEGTYTIRIKDNSGSGTGFPRIYFNNGGDRQKILSVEQWGTGKWTSMENAFYGAINLVINATDVPDLSNVTTMFQMFFGATSLGDGAAGANWSWDTSHVNIMTAMFQNAYHFNKDISSWDVSNVEYMSNMFMNAVAFNQDLNTWNTGNVITMNSMFSGATIFDGNISHWNTSHVTTMNRMFMNAIAFNQDISLKAGVGTGGGDAWDTGAVTDMAYMFYRATVFNQDIGNWNISAVTDTSSMFYNATVFNQDISGWNVSGVTNMNWMLAFMNHFDQNISSWDVDQVTNTTNFLNGTTLSIVNYDALLNGWNAQTLQGGLSFNGGDSKYCAVTAHDNMTSATGHNWTITDGMIDANCPPVITSNGGGNSATIHVDENQTAVTTVIATDPNPENITYQIINSIDDNAQFTIDTNTGVLTFVSAPDFENPTDGNGDNEYHLTVRALDTASHDDTQALTVIVDEVSQSLNSSHHGSGRVSKAKLAEIFKKVETKKDEVKEEQKQETKENKCSFQTYKRLIRFGTKGEDVRKLQETLNALGFNTGIVDGWYGKNTMKGIKAFQTAMGITHDGIFGPQSNGKLSTQCVA